MNWRRRPGPAPRRARRYWLTLGIVLLAQSIYHVAEDRTGNGRGGWWGTGDLIVMILTVGCLLLIWWVPVREDTPDDQD